MASYEVGARVRVHVVNDQRACLVHLLDGTVVRENMNTLDLEDVAVARGQAAYEGGYRGEWALPLGATFLIQILPTEGDA
jgi:RNase P/RNase MRP subunit p29